MFVDCRPRKRNAARPKEKSCPGFQQWVRGRPCACGGRNPECGGKIQFAHGPDKATKGIGTKSTDKIGLPLSERCHAHQHRIGWPEFARRFLVVPDARIVGLAYWDKYPKRREWEAKYG